MEERIKLLLEFVVNGSWSEHSATSQKKHEDTTNRGNVRHGKWRKRGREMEAERKREEEDVEVSKGW